MRTCLPFFLSLPSGFCLKSIGVLQQPSFRRFVAYSEKGYSHKNLADLASELTNKGPNAGSEPWGTERPNASRTWSGLGHMDLVAYTQLLQLVFVNFVRSY